MPDRPFACLFAPLRRVLVAAVATLAAASASAGQTPNLVLIISDDQAWFDYGFMGHPHIATPHLDRLAAESVCYPKGYVPDSLCRPSLMSIMTGLYPHQHGVVGNDPPVPADIAGLGKGEQRKDKRYEQIRNDYLHFVDDADTLADVLVRNGYIAHQSGKWWEGSYQRGGFTDGMTHGDRSRDGRHGDRGLIIGRKTMEPVTAFIDDAVAEDKPFFVYYAPFLPHAPHNPPERLLKKYAKASPHPSIRKYYAMCEWFDETCGTLLDHLEQSGAADNTVVMYVCDNGWITRNDSSRYAERSKRSQYEGGIRTPIMVKAPGVAPRMDTDHAVSSLDLMPTALNALGLDVPSDLPGIDLLDEAAVAERDTLTGEIFLHDVQSMTDHVASLRFRWIIRDGWKLVVPHGPVEPDAPVELFHLALDPHETRNLAEAYPDRVAELTQALDAWWSPGEAAMASR